MAVIETTRREQTGSPGGTLPQPAPQPAPLPAEVALRAFLDGRASEHRLVDLLAFALATEKNQPPTADAVDRSRHEAAAALSDHAFRYLHNSIEQVRRDAVAEHLGRIRKPPGFVALVGANLLALALAGGVAAWLALNPETLAGFTGLFTG